MTATYSLQALSSMDEPAFVAALGDLYEHSPWVAAAAWQSRPFNDRSALQAALSQAMQNADPAKQLALIRAHPELAGKAAVRGELTAESQTEQAGAGLDQCSSQEFEEIQMLNHAWQDKFGFPFVIAVRGLTRADIIAAMRKRLAHDKLTEFGEALHQIDRIAELRLVQRLSA